MSLNSYLSRSRRFGLAVFILSGILYNNISSKAFAQLTPIQSLNLQPQKVLVPEKFNGKISTSLTVQIPEKYQAKIFYTGSELSKPRFFAWSPDSVLHVADFDAQRIYALPDKNNDGVADTLRTVATNITAHDIKFYKGALYAAQERSVLKLEDIDGDGVYEKRTTFIANIAEGATQPGGGHTTRTIMFDSARAKMYLSIGSRCNVCRTNSPGDTDYLRARIEEWDDDGTNRRVYADGIRNAVGLAWRNGKLWATNNGSDNQGNNIPPEWIDIVRENGFYGYPFAHSSGTYFNFGTSASADYRALLPITAQDSQRVASMKQPSALITAHSAPMAIEFANASFPSEFRHGAFVALRGSWNRSPATGGKIIYLDFDDESDTTANFVADFLTGFMTDSTKSTNWGWARPVGLETDSRGNLYVGSDALTRFIMIISPKSVTSIQENQQGSIDPVHTVPTIQLFPQPAQESVIIRSSKNTIYEELEIMTIWGESMGKILLKEAETRLELGDFPSGMYYLRCGSTVVPFSVCK